MAISPTVSVPCADPALEMLKVGVFVKLSTEPLPSTNLSFKVIPDKTTFPLFSTVIVYLIISLAPFTPSPLSITIAVLVTSKIALGVISTIVGSLVVLPSLSSPSSDVSLTLFVCPGEEAVAVAMLETAPVRAAASVMMKYALYVAVSPGRSVPNPEPWFAPEK